MSTAAATAVAFAVAAALSFVAPRRVRSLLVVAVLVVPIALATPRFVRAERRHVAESAVKSPYSPPAPFTFRKLNPALVAGIVDRVPAHDSVSVANASVEQGWVRWLAYSIAPRQLVGVTAPWTIVIGETPAQAGIHPARAWRYGHDWLVER